MCVWKRGHNLIYRGIASLTLGYDKASELQAITITTVLEFKPPSLSLFPLKKQTSSTTLL